MRAATDLLSRYAEYHRDQRNIASHFVGVPMIVSRLSMRVRPAARAAARMRFASRSSG